jgi:hypothetical protein
MSVARHPRPKELEGVPLEEILMKYVGRFKDKKPDWARAGASQRGSGVGSAFRVRPASFTAFRTTRWSRSIFRSCSGAGVGTDGLRR